MAGYIGRDLRAKLENPLVFQQKGAAAGSAVSTAHGYDATILIDICNSVLAAKADGKLKGGRRFDSEILNPYFLPTATLR